MSEFLNYVAKCCFHSTEGHMVHYGCTELGCSCKDLSIERATVLEVLNHEYGTDRDSAFFEYKTEVPKEWPHVLALGPYGKNLVIRLTESNEIYGYDDPVTTANYQVLQENWKDYPSLIDGGYSNCYSIGLSFDDAAPPDLLSVLKSLENYPLLDEELYSTLEWEWIERDWKDYGIFDSRRTLQYLLSEAIGCNPYEIELPDGDWFDNLLQDSIFGDDCRVPYYESGGGSVFSDKEILTDNLAKYGSILFALV